MCLHLIAIGLGNAFSSAKQKGKKETYSLKVEMKITENSAVFLIVILSVIGDMFCLGVTTTVYAVWIELFVIGMIIGIWKKTEQ